jgi:hypothetical protein
MKREIIKFEPKRLKARAAGLILFGDTPFKNKVIEPNTRYTRKAKHPKKECDLNRY